MPENTKDKDISENEALVQRFFDGEASAAEQQEVQALIDSGDSFVKEQLAVLSSLQDGVQSYFSAAAAELDSSYSPGFAWRAIKEEIKTEKKAVSLGLVDSFKKFFDGLLAPVPLAGFALACLGLFLIPNLVSNKFEQDSTDTLIAEQEETRQVQLALSEENDLRPNEELFSEVEISQVIQGRELPKLSFSDADSNDFSGDVKLERSPGGIVSSAPGRVDRVDLEASKPMPSAENLVTGVPVPSSGLEANSFNTGEAVLLKQRIAKFGDALLIENIQAAQNMKPEFLLAGDQGRAPVIWLSRK